MVAPLAGVIVALTMGVSVLLGTVGFVVTFVTVGGGMEAVPLSVMSKAAPTAVSLLAMCSAATLVPALLALNCTSVVVLPPAAIVRASVLFEPGTASSICTEHEAQPCASPMMMTKFGRASAAAR